MERTVVLAVPSGSVEKDASWELYDQAQFLWPLGHGQFFLRRCSQLELLDRSLEPHPFIDMGGSMKAIDISPSHSVMFIEDQPAAQPHPQPTGSSPGQPDPVHPHPSVPELNVNFLHLNPLSVIARSHAQLPGNVPLFSDGFLDLLSAPRNQWVVNFHPFREQMQPQSIAQVRSTCPPQLVVLSEEIFLAIVCHNATQDQHYEVYDRKGNFLWQRDIYADRASPQFVLTADGTRFAVETLHTTHPLAALDPINAPDVDGQIIDIFETLTGKQLLSFRTTPAYSAGQNFDLSPDGTRLAVLHNNAIEIYDLKNLPQGPPPGFR